MSKAITINGVIYPTHTAAAKALGLSPSGFAKRLKRKPEYLDRPFRANLNNAWPITIDGHDYYNLPTLAKKLRLDTATLSTRIKSYRKHNRPLTIESLTGVQRPRIDETINGKHYDFFKDIHHDYNIKMSTLQARYYKQHLHGSDLVRPVQSRRHQRQSGITLEGKHYPTFKAAAEHYQISYVTFMDRLQKYENGNISLEKLIQPVSYKMPLTINGKYFESQIQAANYYHVSKSMFSLMLNKFKQGKITNTEFFNWLNKHQRTRALYWLPSPRRKKDVTKQLKGNIHTEQHNQTIVNGLYDHPQLKNH